jgi:hypothetical protein
MAQDSDSRPARVAEPAFLERKQKADGSVREYRCTLAYQGGALTVVRFPMQRGGAIFATPVVIPSGSVSFGFFWTNRPYNLYRMVTAQGEVIAHRFDAVADVRIGRGELSYRDLVLDWWALPDGTLLAEDTDEFQELVQSDRLSPADAERAQVAARLVYGRYRHIIEQAEALMARAGIRV